MLYLSQEFILTKFSTKKSGNIWKNDDKIRILNITIESKSQTCWPYQPYYRVKGSSFDSCPIITLIIKEVVMMCEGIRKLHWSNWELRKINRFIGELPRINTWDTGFCHEKRLVLNRCQGPFWLASEQSTHTRSRTYTLSEEKLLTITPIFPTILHSPFCKLTEHDFHSFGSIQERLEWSLADWSSASLWVWTRKPNVSIWRVTKFRTNWFSTNSAHQINCYACTRTHSTPTEEQNESNFCAEFTRPVPKSRPRETENNPNKTDRTDPFCNPGVTNLWLVFASWSKRFSPYKRVPVQSHNSFLDQMSRTHCVISQEPFLHSVRTLSEDILLRVRLQQVAAKEEATGNFYEDRDSDVAKVFCWGRE